MRVDRSAANLFVTAVQRNLNLVKVRMAKKLLNKPKTAYFRLFYSFEEKLQANFSLELLLAVS